MSVSKWNWSEVCDSRPCPGDCDNCTYEDEDEERPPLPEWWRDMEEEVQEALDKLTIVRR